MNDIVFMEVSYYVGDLFNDYWSIRFISFESEHKFSTLYIFHEQKDMIIVCKMGVQFHNIRVVEII